MGCHPKNSGRWFLQNHSSEFRRPNIHFQLLGFGIHVQRNSGGTLLVWNFTSQVWQVIYLIFNQQNINVHRWSLSIFSIEHWIGSRENLQEPPLFHGIYLYMYILFIVVYGKNYKKTLDLMVKTHGFRLGFSQQNLSGEAVYTGGSFSSKGGGIMRTLQALAQKVWGNWGLPSGHGPKVSDPVVGWWNMALIFWGIRQLIPWERPSKTREHDD